MDPIQEMTLELALEIFEDDGVLDQIGLTPELSQYAEEIGVIYDAAKKLHKSRIA